MDILKEIHGMLGRVDQKIDGVEKRLIRVEANIDLQNDSIREHGKSLALLRQECTHRKDYCHEKFKHMSSNYHAVSDITGSINISHLQNQAKWKFVKTTAAVLVATLTTLAAVWRIFI